MSQALETRILSEVAAGHRTLDALSASIGLPAAQVDQRIRWAIGQGLLMPTQSGNMWTFALTDAGQRAIVVQSRLAGLAGSARGMTVGGLIGEVRSAISQSSDLDGRPGVTSKPTIPRSLRVGQASTSSSLLSPAEEAAKAERQSWSFAIAVVGTIVLITLVIWAFTG